MQTRPSTRQAREPSWGKIAIIHELAHYWDWSTGSFWSRLFGGPGRLSTGMTGPVDGELGPTSYGRKNVSEEWAESVAMFVYPEYREIPKAEESENFLYQGFFYPGLGPRHWEYVSVQFAALKVE